MNESSDQHTTQEQMPKSGPRCACGGKGPAVSQLLDAMLPSEAVSEHFRNAGLEFLKGFRELLDQSIHSLGQKQNKGTKLNVE